MVRRNGGAAGVDGVTVADVEAYGVERWVGELSRDLRDGAYEPSPVRQVLIPNRNLSTTMGHSTGLIREQCPVW